MPIERSASENCIFFRLQNHLASRFFVFPAHPHVRKSRSSATDPPIELVIIARVAIRRSGAIDLPLDPLRDRVIRSRIGSDDRLFLFLRRLRLRPCLVHPPCHQDHDPHRHQDQQKCHFSPTHRQRLMIDPDGSFANECSTIPHRSNRRNWNRVKPSAPVTKLQFHFRNFSRAMSMSFLSILPPPTPEIMLLNRQCQGPREVFYDTSGRPRRPRKSCRNPDDARGKTAPFCRPRRSRSEKPAPSEAPCGKHCGPRPGLDFSRATAGKQPTSDPDEPWHKPACSPSTFRDAGPSTAAATPSDTP